MSTPEEEIRFAEAFNELGESAELMVDPPTAAAIRGKVRRRRTTQVTVAAVAALALIAPASWMLQQAAGAEERDEPVIAEEQTTQSAESDESVKPLEPTPSSEPTSGTETGTAETEPPPSFDDLLGQEIDLPSFGDLTESPCPTAAAQLAATEEEGAVILFKVVHARLAADGPLQAVALVGCRPGEAMVRQVVAIAADGDGYEVTEQIHLYNYGETPSVYDIAPDADYGVLLGLLSVEPCCSTLIEDVEHWIERYRDGESEEVTGDVPGTFITDLAVSAEVTDSGDGTREVKVTVTNLGEDDATQFALYFCSTAAIRLEGEDNIDCADGADRIETIDGLQAGDSYETTWTMEVDPKEEWSADEASMGASFSVDVGMRRYLVDALVLDTATMNNHAGEYYEYEAAN